MNDSRDKEVEDWESCNELTTSEDDLEGWSDNDDKINPFISSATNKLQLRKHVSKACWDDRLCMAEVTERKGSIWTSTGVIRNGKLYLFLEEALFLAKRGALVVSNSSGESLSVTELFQKLSEPTNRCTFKYFMAYRRLKLLGYVVGRHNVPWTMKSCDRSKCLAKTNNDEVHDEEEDNTFITHLLKDLQINERIPAFVVYLPNSNFKKSSPGKPSFILCMLGDTPPNHSEFDMFESNLHGIPLKYCYVGRSSRAIFFSSKKVELQTLP